MRLDVSGHYIDAASACLVGCLQHRKRFSCPGCVAEKYFQLSKALPSILFPDRFQKLIRIVSWHFHPFSS